MWGYVIALIILISGLIYIRISCKSFLNSRKIIHTIPDMVFILDRSLQILEVHNPDKQFLLAPVETIIGSNLKQFFPEEYIRLFKDAIDKTLETNTTCEVEYQIEIDSQTYYFEARYLKINDNRATSVIRNITERKRSDLAVRQNQKLLNAVLDNIPFPVMLKDVNDNFRYIYWNNECYKQTGSTRDEILGKTDIDLYGEERGGKYRAIDKEVVKNACLYRNPENFITPDGVEHQTIVSKNIISNDIFTWLLVVRWDITDLIQAQRSLNELNHLNQLILNNSNAGYTFIGPDHIVQWENISSYVFSSPISLAYQKGKLCYQTAKGLDHPCPNCIMKKTLVSKKTERQEFSLKGNTTIETIATPIFKENGELQGTVFKVEDITPKKRKEQELREAKENAEKSDRLKSAFLANISHEIRTPLNAIVGFSELLCNTDIAQEKENYIRIIRKNNEALLLLISDILDISKIETNTFEIFYSDIDINRMLDEFYTTTVCKMLPDDPPEIIFKPGLTECMIYSDKDRLIQILFNLVNNALKFTEKGKITIGYELQNNELYFYVSDTGIGIPKEKQKMIFERFVKLDDFKDGTGLGLAISQMIVHKLKGNIGVISNPGEGSTFWFTIPYSS